METVDETHALLDGRFRGDERKRGKKRGRKKNVGVDVTVMIGCEEAFRLREHRAQYRHSEGVFLDFSDDGEVELFPAGDEAFGAGEENGAEGEVCLVE